ncbi:MAG TPA: DUF2148 domain-containing protein [Bacteroidales bacterium]|nr:DUF2148 domain-containing protein [Bacteroidales bacterium]
MAFFTENQVKDETLLEVAKKMLIAARTAPKGRGFDNLALAIVTGNELKKLCEEVIAIGEKESNPTFLRDGNNVLQSAGVVLLLGTRIKPLGLKICGLCGFGNCAGKEQYPDAPCIFNTSDLGTATGSAVALAADHRVDTRIMYTLGYAAVRMQLLGPEYKIAYGIPLSALSKNPFFDRK